MAATPNKNEPNPREKASFTSKLLFWWIAPLMRLGNQRPLTADDLYRAQTEDSSHKLADAIHKEWEAERSKRKPSYVRALIRCFGMRAACFGILLGIEECVIRVAQPLFLGGLIRHYRGDPGYDTPRTGWFCGGGIVLAALLYIFTHHTYFWHMDYVAMRIRVASCAMIYRKVLRLSHSATHKTNIGQMVNLLSNDVNRLDFSMVLLHYFWVGPLQTLIVGVFLWQQLGVSSVVVVIMLVLLLPVQSVLGKMCSRLRLSTAQHTDRRIHLMTEILGAMRAIKMYTWENLFTWIIEEARRAEVATLMKTNYCRAVNLSLYFTSSKGVLCLTLLIYVLSGNQLMAEDVFVTSALISNLVVTMTFFMPSAISLGSETLVSCNRIQDFLEMEEREELIREHTSPTKTKLKECYVRLRGLSAKWSETGGDTLSGVTCAVEAGQLFTVTGPVGSGKSSLLMAILGELRRHCGSVEVRGKVSYVPQQPWVFSGTLRQNILFGQPYNHRRYQQVIEVCVLRQDLDQLPEGDMSRVGERGVILSGGQKARVSLARAVYGEADIYLLDDPLSAVDSHVKRHLVERCILGFLHNKIRILVTHHLDHHLLAQATGITIREGRLESTNNNPSLITDLLHTHGVKYSEESDIMNLVPKLSYPWKSTRSTTISRQGQERNNTDNCPLLSAQGSSKMYSSIGDNLDGSACNRTQHVAGDTDTGGDGEDVSVGWVKGAVYLQYLRAGGSCWFVSLTFVIIIAAQALFTASDYYLAQWVNIEEHNPGHLSLASNTTTVTWLANNTHLSPGLQEHDTGHPTLQHNIYIYAGIAVGLFFASFARTILFYMVCLTSSRTLHNNMFHSIIRAPQQFFDTRPVGQLLNWFAKDIGHIDDLLPTAQFDVILNVFLFMGVMVILVWVNLWLLLPLLLLLGACCLLHRFYTPTSQNLRRLEAVSRSPVFSHLSVSLQGLTTIRAFQSQQSFIQDFDVYQDQHTSAFFLVMSSMQWYGMCVDWFTWIFITIVVFTIINMDNLLGGDIGVSISAVLTVGGLFQWSLRQLAAVQNYMTSVERVIQYSKVTPEAPLTTSLTACKPSSEWPDKGVIEFINVSLQYKAFEPPVLRNINFSISSREKIGIVGRTGAGKSSILTALFRLTEPSGTINIDGVNIQDLGLHDVRGNISIIPQDPTLFTGTFRQNLDPLCQYTDEQLWIALGEVQLRDTVVALVGGLEATVAEGGSNLSVGERQLVCLARVLLNNNRILVFDEATANIDTRTDHLIQRTIRTKFADCTVLTIAHRLQTIMDSDRVMVLHQGRLQEFDEPHALITNKDSMFTSLVHQAGQEASSLVRTAEKAHVKRQKGTFTSRDKTDDPDQ